MWGRTPPKAMVARIRVSSSSSPRMASCKWRGVIRLTLRSLAAFCRGPKILRQHPGQEAIGSSRAVSQHVGDKRNAWTYACKLKNFSSQILEHSGDVDGSFGADAHLVLGVRLEKPLDTTAGKLQSDPVSEGRMAG